MKKSFKWIAGAIGALVLVFIIAALIAPKLVDVDKYKPAMEKYVSEMTGRPFSIDGELAFSLFPRIEFSFSDLRLGSPPGFSEKYLLAIENFDAQLKLAPLVSGHIEVDRFRLDGLRLTLEKKGDGLGNWEAPVKPDSQVPEARDKEAPVGQSGGGLPILSLAVEEFVVSNASVLWIDAGRGTRHELAGVHLTLKGLSYENPVGIDFSGRFDGKPIAVRGKVGPLGKNPGKGALPVEIVISFMEEAHLSLTGTLRDPVQNPAFDFKVALAPFSPRRLAAAGGGDEAFKTADPGVLEHLALEAGVAGDLTRVSVSDGRVELDDSRIVLVATVKDFPRPNVAFDLEIDRIDLDRYMPPAQKNMPGELPRPPSAPAKNAPPRRNVDAALKSLVVEASLSVGRLTAQRVVAENLRAKLSVAKGIFQLRPVSASLYGGILDFTGVFDLNRALTTSRIELEANRIQAGPLVLAFFKKDVIEGELQGRAALTMSGRRVEDIKKTLNGTTEFIFQNGVIKGIDLAAIAGAAENVLDLSLYQGKGSRTEFSELRAPFIVANGKARTDESALSSPLIGMTAAGTADLVAEALDFRIQPQFAYTTEKKGRTKRTEIRVPLLLGGTFSEPELRPDLNALAQDQLEKRVLESKEFKEVFKNKKLKPFEEATKGLLKGLLSR